MLSVTSASRYQSRSSMYIRYLIPRNLVEVVLIDGMGYQTLFHASSRLFNFIIYLICGIELVYDPFSNPQPSRWWRPRARNIGINIHDCKPLKVGQKVPFSQCIVCKFFKCAFITSFKFNDQHVNFFWRCSPVNNTSDKIIEMQIIKPSASEYTLLNN